LVPAFPGSNPGAPAILVTGLMSKAFTKEGDGGDEDDDIDVPESLPADLKNYMTPKGAAALQKELKELQEIERPKIVEIVSWAAGNGDRSENGDYIYGKKRLREIDKRLRYLLKRLQSAEIVDPAKQQGLEQVFFGATVTYVGAGDEECTIQLVGIDEADINLGKISWISPLAKTLMKARAGDVLALNAPGGSIPIEIVDIRYVLEI
jgi:transcription elongation factor GreB